MNISIRESNKKEITNNQVFSVVISEIKEVERFVSNYGFLSFGRDFVLCKNRSFSLQKLLVSAELTLGSIAACCENYCIADANILLRKYRDDMFFYLYLIVYDVEFKRGNDVSKIESIIERWLNNELKNLFIFEVIKTIGQDDILSDFMSKFHCDVRLKEIANRLNNFTHGNGLRYYNSNFVGKTDDEINDELTRIAIDLRFITVFVLFLTIICCPFQIMSHDYIDCLEFNMTPEERLLYEVPPFIKKFINKNAEIISKDAYNWLKKNSCMNI